MVGPASQPNYLVVTSSPTATIPDLTALGLGLPKGIVYNWYVVAIGPFANVDDAAGAAGILPKTDRIQATSSTRTFTTAP